jgi:hypothetical protein
MAAQDSHDRRRLRAFSRIAMGQSMQGMKAKHHIASRR